MQKLPDVLDREYIQLARQRVLKELTVVSKKVFQLILEKQSSYTGEIQRYKLCYYETYITNKCKSVHRYRVQSF